MELYLSNGVISNRLYQISQYKIRYFEMGLGSRKKDPFNRRTYEKSIEDIDMPPHYFGFTNRILSQTEGSTVHLFVPVYLILRIKSLQGIDVQNLTGQISAVLIVNVLIENLPEPLIFLLSNQMELQINRSEPLFLRDDRQNCVLVTRTKKMLRFTIRKNFMATVIEETFWSPFLILRLVVSITFNNIRKRNGMEIQTAYLKKEEEKNQNVEMGKNLAGAFGLPAPQDQKESSNRNIEFNQFRYYSVSFNCMRNGLKIPISYSLGCVYSLYDLAETMLEVYHTHLNSYSEVTQRYRELEQSKRKKSFWQRLFGRKEEQAEKEVWEPEEGEDGISKKKSKEDLVRMNREVYRLLEERRQRREKKKESSCSPNYSQYTHFVIPLYKYPGNSLLTIFIPVALLSLLSLAIFFQDNNLSERIGLIATMVLGYIQLIPSIKNELPPSSKITAIEIVIYLSTLCCLFSLIESFLIDHRQDYVFVWSQNGLFLFCLITHTCIFLFVSGLFVVHKLVWEPSYNMEEEPRKTDPEQDPQEWINMFCDQQFYIANETIHRHNSNPKNAQKKKQFITKYNFSLEGEHTYEKKGKKEQEQIKSDLRLTTLFSSVKNLAEPVQQGKSSLETMKMSKENSLLEISLPAEEESPPLGATQMMLQPEGLSESKSKGKEKQKEKEGELEYSRRLRLLDRIFKEDKHISWDKEAGVFRIARKAQLSKQKKE